MDRQKQNEKYAGYTAPGDMDQKYPGLGIRHLQMAAMTLTITALFIARGSMGVAVLAMSGDARREDSDIQVYNWDKHTQGLILSSFFWGYVPMQIPAGVLSKKFGGKPILLAALLLNGALCCLLPSLAALGDWPLVCASRVGIGLSQACLFPASHTLLGQWLPPSEQTSYSGIVYGGVQLGTIIAMPVSGLLAETALGWKLIFYAMGGLLFVTGGIWYWFAASTPGEHRMISKAEQQYIETGLNSSAGHVSMSPPWKAILTSVPAWAMLPPQIGAIISFVLFLVDMPAYLEKGLHISLKDSAYLSALPYIGMWIGNTVSTIIGEKLINKNILKTGPCRKVFNSLAMFGITAALIALAFIGPENKVWAIVALIGGLTLSGFTSAGYMMNYLDLSPNFAGVLISMANSIAHSGSIVMPILTSHILQNDSSNLERWRVVFLVTGAITAGTNIVYLIFSTSDKQPWNDPDYYDKIKADPEEMRVFKTNVQEKADKEKEKEVETN